MSSELSVRVTFENVALPLFQHLLTDELAADGIRVVYGPSAPEERGATREVVEVVRVAVEALGMIKAAEDGRSYVTRIVRAIQDAVQKGKRVPEMEITIYGPDGKPLKTVRVPAKRRDA